MFDRNVKLLLSGTFLFGIAFSFFMLFFNLYLRELGVEVLGMTETDSYRFVGNANSIAQLAVGLLALPAGYIAVRFRQKWIFIIAQIGQSIFFALAICLESEGAVYLTLAVAGICTAFARVIAGPFIMRNSTPKERTYIFSIHFILMLASGVIGNIGAGALREALLGLDLNSLEAYRATLVVGFGLGFLGVVPYFFIRSFKPTAEDTKQLSFGNITKWNWSFFGKALLPSAMLSIGSGLIVQFLNLYFRDVFDSSDKSISFYMAAQQITMVLGLLLAPALAEKFGKVNTIVLSQLLSIPFMAILAFTGQIEIAFVAFIMRAALMNMSMPVSHTMLMELCRKSEQGILSAFFILQWTTSWAIAAQIFGTLLGEDKNYFRVFAIAIILYFVSTILYYVFFKDSEKDIGDEEVVEDVLKPKEAV